MELTQKELKSFLSYDPGTGVFVWRVNRGGWVKSGDVAGGLDGDGYRLININGRKRGAHRLAWLYVNGYWPTNLIDHINGIKDDNRLENLREATRSQNKANSVISKNNTSGFKGITRREHKWQTRIYVNGRSIHVGVYQTKEAAHAAYCAAADAHFSEFANYGHKKQQPKESACV